MRRAWGCPAGRPRGLAVVDDPPATDAHLSPACRTALATCAERFGTVGFTTCPLWYASLPWVHRAAEASMVLDKPVFPMLYPRASQPFLQAALAVRDGVERRLAWDRKHPPDPKPPKP